MMNSKFVAAAKAHTSKYTSHYVEIIPRSNHIAKSIYAQNKVKQLYDQELEYE